MATSQWANVRDALVDRIGAALPDVRVTRGRDRSLNPDDVVMVGVRDFSPTTLENAGDLNQEFLAYGGSRNEAGTVNGLIIARDGTELSVTEAAAFGYLAAIETAIRADNTLGLAGSGYMVVQLQAGAIEESQNTDGALTVLHFTVQYQAGI